MVSYAGYGDEEDDYMDYGNDSQANFYSDAYCAGPNGSLREDIDMFSSQPAEKLYRGQYITYDQASVTSLDHCPDGYDDVLEEYMDLDGSNDQTIRWPRTPDRSRNLPSNYGHVNPRQTNPGSGAKESQRTDYHPISSFKPPLVSREDISRRLGPSVQDTPERALRSVSSLPDVYRAIFNFGVFNAMQSSCFDYILHSDENMVVSAPTGSGKTVLFELAMIRMLKDPENADRLWKCVYIAPTKALCAEKHRDWSKKFGPLGIKCCELTGDTVLFGKGAWGDAKNSSIIVTTAEKWDSLTRNWGDNVRILSSVHLFLVDEVHILNENRGSTLETVISRMKSRGSSVRFILLSATVPNIIDVASWIGNSQSRSPARVCEFGEEYRPCKLKRVVIGVYRPKGQNDFVFNRTLDYKLFGTLQQHSVGKPILVFCSTRKGVSSTADQLMKEFTEAENLRQTLPWSRPKGNETTGFEDKRVAGFALCGIGIHHAGLSLIDRRLVEDLYLKRILRIVVATSTLAVGVNLPAHLVVIKGVQTFQNNASVEYSDLDVMQMLGRAGRPQFDKDGIAVILCEESLENKYKALVQGRTILESSLHNNLSEHLNSEVGLGTITSVESAKDWLRGSFLFQRIQKNPGHYCIKKDDMQTWEERIDELVVESLGQLRANTLIEGGEGEIQALHSTEYGDIMSKFYIRQTTMASILALSESPTIRELLEMLASADEFSDVKLRASEKTVLNKLRKHNDIRFEMLKLEKSADKVFLLIQAILSGISLTTAEFRSGDSQLYLEALAVFRHSTRVARAIVEVGIAKSNALLIKNGLELVRCMTARAWEDRPVVLRQINGIGEKSLMILAEHGINSIEKLRNQNPQRIEMLLNRNPPFGLEVLAAVKELPQYSLSINQSGVRSSGGTGPIEVELVVECGLDESEMGGAGNRSKKHKIPKFSMTAVLTMTSDMIFLDFRRIPTKALKDSKTFAITAQMTKPSQSIVVVICAESIAGVTIMKTFRPNVPPGEYPTPNTRPPTIEECDLAGLEDDPDFWNMESDASEETVKIRDLTAKDKKKISGQPSLSSRPTVPATEPKKYPPKKLPNGRFECNHPCRDKTSCRHFCCRDGLPAPPLSSKKKTVSKDCAPKQSLEELTFSQEKPQKRVEKEQSKDDRMQKLDQLHEKTKVRSNIQLSPGHRLKIDSSLPSRKKNPIPDFEVQFSDLNETQAHMDLPPREFMVNLDHDDDFPETHELIKTEAQSFSSDGLSRDLDVADRPVPSSPGCPFQGGGYGWETSPSRRKRSLSSSLTSPPRKKVKGGVRADDLLVGMEPEVDTDVPLFLPSSSDGKCLTSRQHRKICLSPNQAHHRDEILGSPQSVSESGGTRGGHEDFNQTPMEVSIEHEDELDELDAFLNSNAVEII